ncbi:putative bifunctional P-450:NADPH-P450 reductase [Ophiocordyceps camponoti-floridani]|uniref:Putative bifunctional P-450:NADPH-P450 reductase n=1 Tax=Ophiocordyceps camponoti-floridani TaxID=2030778 RepID=A0A8H4Q0M9_9HYPO|nr:putative bifunctional P-450:NADPH-P450 reductase [Ophiocordyceps camponoti-floridani]
MTGLLSESSARAKRPSLIGKLHKESNRKYKEDIETLESIAGEMLQKRRQHPTDDQDLLNAMINGKDPKTGQKLRDETIIANMITFLIAGEVTICRNERHRFDSANLGHETTSGLLSFLFYELLQSPEALKEATKEVDNVIGTAPVTVEHMTKLPYIEACLRETLRLHPTAPAFSLEAKGGPAMFGSDAEEFRPSRMYGSNTGTCEALAQSLACSAPDHGFEAEVKDLDSAPSALSAEIPAVVITASYEGQPPDNAGHFVEGLKTASKDDSKRESTLPSLESETVSREWRETYQRIPIVIDEALVEAGANQLAPRAAVDVTQGNILDALYDWQEKSLWPALSKQESLSGKQRRRAWSSRPRDRDADAF